MKSIFTSLILFVAIAANAAVDGKTFSDGWYRTNGPSMGDITPTENTNRSLGKKSAVVPTHQILNIQGSSVFRRRNNTNYVSEEYVDSFGVINTNLTLTTNGVPDFPTGLSASQLDVTRQTVGSLIVTGATNTLASINSTGRVVAIPVGVVGNPLAYNTSGGGFTNQLNVNRINGTGTGTGISIPTNVYAKNILVTQAVFFVSTIKTAPDAGTTNYFADLNVGRTYIQLTNNLNFVHSTNRALSVWTEIEWKICTGNSNRVLTLNSGWWATNTTILLASNRFYTAKIAHDGSTLSETNVAFTIQ